MKKNVFEGAYEAPVVVLETVEVENGFAFSTEDSDEW